MFTAVLIVLLALQVAVTPLDAEAQQPTKVYQVGLLATGGNQKTWRDQYAPFLQAMRELNYIEGRNLAIRPAFADGKVERLPSLVADLITAKVDVIVSTAVAETVAAKKATSSIPIVMWLVGDPVADGLVETLARPGANVTGLTNLAVGLSQKYVELLKEVVPSAARFAAVASPHNPRLNIRQELEAAGRVLGVTISVLHVSNPGDFDDVLARAKSDGAAGIIATTDALTYLHRRTFAAAALKHRLPAIYWSRDYVDEGGLMTYGANVNDLRRRAATYVDKILRGANPANLPVEQPTRFELVINAKAAHVLNLTIPPSLLLRADQVIE